MPCWVSCITGCAVIDKIINDMVGCCILMQSKVQSWRYANKSSQRLFYSISDYTLLWSFVSHLSELAVHNNCKAVSLNMKTLFLVNRAFEINIVKIHIQTVDVCT